LVHLVKGAGTFSRTLFTVGGLASTTLTLVESGEITASVNTVSAVASVKVIHPSIDVEVSPDIEDIYSGETVTLQYTVSNTGDTPLTGVTVIDDYGTPEGWQPASLEIGATRLYSRTMAATETMTIAATASGVDLLGNTVSQQATATVTVKIFSAFVPLVVK
jgi:hypothetical protein